MAKKGKDALQRESCEVYYHFDVEQDLGEGGNAKVFIATTKEDGSEVALKLLQKKNEESESRFADEVSIMCEWYPKVGGILPIIKADIDHFWYSMPIAIPIIEKVKSISDDRIETVVEYIIDLCTTLSQLHSNGISHRDIKPDNIYIYQDKPCFGDFGLVDFPDKENNKTRNDRGLGAVFTIAPEMKRNPVDQDGRKADVYSLAKTLWMLLTLEEKGFDGKYNRMDDEHRLANFNGLETAYLVEIEKLLAWATENDPIKRPAIDEFKEMLVKWRPSNADSEIAQRNEWRFMIEAAFGGFSPSSCEFRDVDEIVRILNVIGKSSAYNHMLFSKGGLDFTSAMRAPEEGCIYLYNRPFWTIIKPKALYFESFRDCRWNYFLLEADHLDYIYNDNEDEDLVEDNPGHYVPSTYVEYGVYDYDEGTPYPKGYKHVNRYTRGKFLIVLKGGPYNKIPSTYDGRHVYCTNIEFRDYLKDLEAALNKVKADYPEYQEHNLLGSMFFQKNPFADRMPDMELPDLGPTLPDGSGFVESQFQGWNFSDIIGGIPSDQGNLDYYLKVMVNDRGFRPFAPLCEFYYLAQDGSFKKSENHQMENPFFIQGREQIKQVYEAIMNRVFEICSEYDQDSVRNSFSLEIRWKRNAIPQYLFTKADIENVMRNADDRISNKLVICDDGHVMIVPFEENARLFCVVHFAWGGFKRYVGKYSSLSTLDETYNDSLACWLEYLKTGEYQFCDENMFCDEEATLSEIKQIMEID